MMLSGSLGADALAAITTLGFTFMALDCFDALLNWTNEHSYVKAIVTGSSDGTFTDEQLAATVIQRYFESNPDLLPTAQGRRFFTFVGFQERAIVKFSMGFSFAASPAGDWQWGPPAPGPSSGEPGCCSSRIGFQFGRS